MQSYQNNIYLFISIGMILFIVLLIQVFNIKNNYAEVIFMNVNLNSKLKAYPSRKYDIKIDFQWYSCNLKEKKGKN